MPSESGASGDRVRHEPDSRRFAVSSGATLAVLEYRQAGPGTVEFHHTYVPPALRGRGIASQLAAFALRDALDKSLTVIPTCPFVARFIRRHPEYASVLGR